MTAEDHLLSLFEQAQDKIQNTCSSFEEHFSWLEEAIIAAKQTFYHHDAVLLPKTPAAKKRGRAKKSDSAISMDDGESPSKRSSTESTRSQSEKQSPECMPRRTGRAASRIAQERVAKSFKESNKRKLRRPSTPIESTRTIKKTKNTKQMEVDRESLEIISKEPQEKLMCHNSSKSKDQHLSSNKIKSPSPSLKRDEIPVVTRNSGNSGEKTFLTQSSSEETVECYEGSTDAVEDRSSERYSSASSLAGESHQKCYSEAKGECEKKLSIPACSGLGSVYNEVESSNIKDTVKGTELSESADSKAKSNLSGLETCGDGESNNEIQIESVAPVPKTRITRTKQREILLSSSEENLQSLDSSASSSTRTQPVPKPRSNRTKQKVHSQAEIGLEEKETQMLPPTDIPIVISKQKMGESMCKEFGERESSIRAEEDGSKDAAESVPQLSPKMRSTRTKKRIEELLDDIVIENVSKARSTRTKKKVEEVSIESVKNDVLIEKLLESDNSLSPNNSRSTQTKKRQVEDQTASQPVRSTRTKRQKKEEEASKESDKENVSCFSVSSNEFKSSGNPVINNSAVTKNNQTVTDSVSTGTSEITIASVSENAVWRVENDKNALHHSNTNSRITRSKVRQVPPVKKSPKNGSPYIKKNFRSPSQQTKSPSTPNRDPFKRDCCTPKSPDKSTAKTHQPMSSRVASPLRNSPRLVTSDKISKPGRAPFKKCDALCEVEEIASDAIEVASSPARVTRHSQGKAVKRESSTVRSARLSLKKAKKIAIAAASRRSSEDETPDSRWARINPQPRTPSPKCPSDKIVRPKMAHLSGSSSHGSSHRIAPKTYSRIQQGYVLPSSSSSDRHKTQKTITTPNDIIRNKNIITGVTSFIKVHPSKPTREELEEKKQLELQKKRERGEETIKKKEELLKSKVEEQKRRNEERMRRAKELREEKERKLLEAKEQQEKDRRIRDERLKDEQNRKKNQLLAQKQALEEVKARKLREQMEEERRLEEARKAEEARKFEEARQAEAERKAEQLRLQDEEKRKRIAEVERIAREREEMEQLRQREEERLALAKQLKSNAIVRVVALNSTFTKESDDNKENYSKHNGTFTKSSSSGKDRSDSYEMTPDQKKKPKKIKVKNDYDIADIKSDDSTDDERAPKKSIPAWAQNQQLKASLINQEYYPPDMNTIFPPEELLTMPDLVKIFPIVRKRFMKRTSSAMWNTPPGKYSD